MPVEQSIALRLRYEEDKIKSLVVLGRQGDIAKPILVLLAYLGCHSTIMICIRC